MKDTGLKILLPGQHFLAVVLPEAEVYKIMDSWISQVGNQLAIITYKMDDGTRWSVRVKDVILMHTFDPAMLNTGGPQGRWPTGGTFGSGLS